MRVEFSKEFEKAVSVYEEGTLLMVDKDALAYMDLISRKRGTIKKGAAPDYERCANLLIDDLRGPLGFRRREQRLGICFFHTKNLPKLHFFLA